jgi:hypothetical protein
MELRFEITRERKRFKARTCSIIGDEMLFDEKIISKLGAGLFYQLFSTIKDNLHRCLNAPNPVDNISYIVDTQLNEIRWGLLFIVMQRGGS